MSIHNVAEAKAKVEAEVVPGPNLKLKGKCSVKFMANLIMMQSIVSTSMIP
ncbi:hypothetical protein L195_g062545, partial [Trifolium pratense]